jgi:6-phosphogluconate dehydrogenase
VIEAQHLAAPVPAIDAAVVARNLSSKRAARTQGEAIFGAAPQAITSITSADIEGALIAGKIICYAQGFEMITKASAQFGWTLPLPDIARVWRAGCIIRSKMLDDMADALTDDAGRNLMFAPYFSSLLKSNHDALRRVVAAAALGGIAMPALSSGLAYFDAMRTARGTANMIQGQRDFFGAHGFETMDGGTDQHGPWGS